MALIDIAEAGVLYEQIAALRPDVILARTFFELDRNFDRLSDIAPVVGYRRGSYVDTWQEQASLIGEPWARKTPPRTLCAPLRNASPASPPTIPAGPARRSPYRSTSTSGRSRPHQPPLFANLAAVREERYVFVDLVTVSALRTPMLRGIDHALDQLVPRLTEALAEDPKPS